MYHKNNSRCQLVGIILALVLVTTMLAGCGSGGTPMKPVQPGPQYGSSTPQPLAPHNTNVITATAGAGGSISPSGTVIVPVHTNKTFTIDPNNGYKIADVKVDGASVGPGKHLYFQ